MKVFKTDSPFELAVQEVEAFLKDKGIRIVSRGNCGLVIESEQHKVSARIQTPEEYSFEFPRVFEEERLVIIE